MQIKKRLAKIVFCLVIMSLITTSFGGAWATAVYAAPVAQEEETVRNNDNKSAIGGIIALGLLAVLVSKKGGSSDSKKNSDTTTPDTSKPPTNSGSGLTAEEAEALRLLNADRAAKGLAALKSNGSLVRLAEDYAQDMIDRNFFSHYNPEGQSPFDRMQQAGISYKSAGENLAINSSVAAAEKALMNSSGHRANILSSKYSEVGVGVRRDSDGSVYVVQEFIGK